MRKLFTFILFGMALVVMAQNDAALLEVLKQKGILSDAEYLELKLSAPDSVITAPSAESEKFKPTFTVRGMAHLAYTYQDAPYVTVNNNFDLVRACIWGGVQVTRSIDLFGIYYLHPSHTQRVHELFARWRIHPAVGFRVGLMKNPMSYENNISIVAMHTIDFAQSVDALTGGASDVIAPSAGRDAGAEVFGQFFKQSNRYLFDYRAGVFNGSGIAMVKDNNSQKDFAAALNFHPIKGTTIGGSGYVGTAFYQMAGEEVLRNHSRNRWILSAVHDSRWVYFRSEYLRGYDDVINRQGFYALGIVRPIPQLDIVLGYDWYQSDMSLSRSSVKYSCGVNYRFTNRIRVQSFFSFTEHDPKSDYLKNTHKFVTQLELGF